MATGEDTDYGKVTRAAANNESILSRAATNPESPVYYLVKTLPDDVGFIRDSLSSGTRDGMLRAMNRWDEVMSVIDDPDNNEVFTTLGRLPDLGPRSRQIATAAQYATEYKFKDDTVTLPGSEQMKLGDVFREGSKVRSDPGYFLRSSGRYDDDVVDAVISDSTDPRKRSTLKLFMDDTEGPGSAKTGRFAPARPNEDRYAQNSQAMRAIMDHWDEAVKAFGTGVPGPDGATAYEGGDVAAASFFKRVREFCRDIGGYNYMVPGMIKYVESRNAAAGRSGVSGVNAALNELSTVAQASMVTDTGAPVSAEDAPYVKRSMNAMLLETINAFAAAGVDADLSNPKYSDAFNKCLGFAARMRASDVNMTEITAGGKSWEKLAAEYIAAAGSPDQRTTTLYNWLGGSSGDPTPGFYAMLERAITGGESFVPDNNSTPSVDRKDWESPRRAAGGRSSSPIADDLARGWVARIGAHVMKYGLSKSLTPTAAINAMAKNDSRLYDDLVTSLVKFGTGPGFIDNEEAVRMLAGDVLLTARGLSGKLSLERLALDRAQSETFRTANPAAAASLTKWAAANGEFAHRYSEQYTAVRNHAIDVLGLSEREAIVYVSDVLQRAMQAERRYLAEPDDAAREKYHPMHVFKAAVEHGPYYKPVDDKVLGTDADDQTEVSRAYTDSLSAVRRKRSDLFEPGVQKFLKTRYDAISARRDQLSAVQGRYDLDVDKKRRMKQLELSGMAPEPPAQTE